MTNQGADTDAVSSLDPNSLEKCQVVDTSQGHASSYMSLSTGSEALPWPMQGSDNCSVANGIPMDSSCHYDQSTDSHPSNLQDGSNVTTCAGTSSSLGTTAVPQEYSGCASYPSSSDPYGYEYSGYYNYPQQSNHSYPQPVGAYQNTGAPYQPLSSFQNTDGPASYSSTYYNPGDYQTSGAYQSSGYSDQTNIWSAHYPNYAPYQYPNYTPDSNGAYISNATSAHSLQYQQGYKHWADYYSQTEVTCAPGTENLFVTSASAPTVPCPIPGVTGGYLPSSFQQPQSYNSSWKPDLVSSQLPSVQGGTLVNDAYNSYKNQEVPRFPNNHVSHFQPHCQNHLESKPTSDSFQGWQNIACPQGSNSQDSATHQFSQDFSSSLHNIPSLDTHRASTMQIPTNPRIASNLPLLKNDKGGCAASSASKPAYISVSLSKPNDKALSRDAPVSTLKSAGFPPSVRGYVERALALCKDDEQKKACQDVMKDMFTAAIADGTLYTRDWDTEPLPPPPNSYMFNKGSMRCSSPVTSLPKCKRSPTRRTKSRWEPIEDEKLTEKAATVNHKNIDYGTWAQYDGVNKKFPARGFDRKDAGLSNTTFISLEQSSATKNIQRPGKRLRVGADPSASAAVLDASSDSDKEQNLTAYTSGAMALADSPEERKKRESRSKRFEKGHGHRGREVPHSGLKNSGVGNLSAQRACDLATSKVFEDGSSRAVEDIDWDSLTVKGTCQEIEKRYLRLTSAPDPSTVRPEEVLEKALHMVQASQKNYLYKCDQLKSIRQDLTVQWINNELTVKVYETHARLALEVGDLPEYNQCASQLRSLYAEGINGCHMEFCAYNLLCVIMHSTNKRDLLSSMYRLSDEAKKDAGVKHALAVRSAFSAGNYVKFFRLYRAAPNLNACLMDLYVEKMRYAAVRCMSRSYRPTVPISYVSWVLGFTGDNGEDGDGLEECVEWLKVHGACLAGEMQLDTKASSSSLFMPEPEDAVAHGDASLAVNDFLTRI